MTKQGQHHSQVSTNSWVERPQPNRQSTTTPKKEISIGQTGKARQRGEPVFASEGDLLGISLTLIFAPTRFETLVINQSSPYKKSTIHIGTIQ